MYVSIFIQQVLNGLTLGAVYTLIALAFSLVMGVLGILNLAIAEIFMFGAYLGFALLLSGFPLWLALVAAMAGTAIIGAIVARIGYEPLRNAGHVTPMLSTLGFSMILQNLATNLWGSDPLQLSLDGLLATRFSIGLVSISLVQIIVIVVTVLFCVVIGLLIQRSAVGRALRAVAESREISRLLGIYPGRLILITFALSGALAGAAGVLVGVQYSAITPYIGADVGVKAIAVMVVGGATNIWGALLAGPIIGVLEVLTVAYLGAELRDFIVYGLMIVILLVRPQGLLGGSAKTSGGRV
ncbi:branched-chain amino acid ABC transporter permease [Thioclava sp. GXIMD2076]|uniref:Branched-chain amino acid ABC transporter permease n=1 Tax=Thioclava kandeliae TaxID=3070818 RepID=A0ABV1SDS4_9RHOB